MGCGPIRLGRRTAKFQGREAYLNKVVTPYARYAAYCQLATGNVKVLPKCPCESIKPGTT